MLDKKSVTFINSFFWKKALVKPNFIFPGIIFDPAVRKENNIETPLRSKIKPSYDMPGCYVFFEPCNQDSKIEIMYVGRSKTLRNRLGGHWRAQHEGKNIITEWGEYCWSNNFPFCPYVAIFVFYGDIRILELDLMIKLKPKFNTH